MLIVFSGVAVLLAMAVGHRALSTVLNVPDRAPEGPPNWPSITIIRPIRALDEGARENLEALFTVDYPAPVQVLFVLDDVDDAAYPVTEEVAKQRLAEGHDVNLLLSGTPPAGRTGKLHAMIAGLEHATGELVAFSDSDTRVTSEQLRAVVRTLLATPKAGDAFSPVVVKWETPNPSAGDVGFALLLNGWYGPSAALAAGVESQLPFIMGQFMVFRRKTFEAIGGLSCADGQLVDDMWIGHRVAEAGLRNVQSRTPLPIITGGLSMSGFIMTFRRWLLFSRSGLPKSFTRPHWVRGALYGASLVLAGVSLARADIPGFVVSLAATGFFVVSQLQLHRKLGGLPIPLRHFWVPALLPLVGGGVMLSALFSKSVDWRGRVYRLDAGARLQPGQAGSRT